MAEPNPTTTATTEQPTTADSTTTTTTADSTTEPAPKATNATLKRAGQTADGFTLMVEGKEQPITSFDFAGGGPKGVTIYGYDPVTDSLIYTCPKTAHNEHWYPSAKKKVSGIRNANKTIDAAVRAANAVGQRPISLQGISKVLKLTPQQKEALKSGKLTLTPEQFEILQKSYGQMHILDGKTQAPSKGKAPAKTPVEPAQTPTVAQTEVDAAKAEQKSGWDKFCDHMKEHWWKYLLALITIGVIGYFGFRKGGWWNKKSKSTPSVTPSVPGIGDLGGNDSGKEDSKATGLSSLTQGALLGMTKVDGSKTGTDGEIIGLGGIGNRRS